MTAHPNPLNIPNDVLDLLRQVFAECNHRASYKLTDNPATREESLDETLIESLSHFEAPLRLSSGWTIRFETHFLGGGRHWGKWEVADVGLLLMCRAGGKNRLTKVALLQSKRLYANELKLDEMSHLDYMIGFRRLFEQDDEWREVAKPRTFTFSNTSRYKALEKDDDQYKHIEAYEKEVSIPIYYLLYNPWELPWRRDFPLTFGRPEPKACDIGCRVLPATNVRDALKSQAQGYSPSYQDLYCAAPKTTLAYPENWRLEDFAVDLMLSCQTGHIATSPDDAGLNTVFNRRSGPLNSSISITVDAPEGFSFE